MINMDSFRIVLFSTLFLPCIFCAHVELFKNADFTGLLFQSNSTANCTNLPGSLHFSVKSIKTDACLIAYEHHNCVSSYSDKSTPERSASIDMRSFHLCNDTEGGPTLNVDINKCYTTNNQTVPKVLEHFYDVCSCINVPLLISKLDKWCIDNHGNELLAYYEPNCVENKWAAVQLRAGNSYTPTSSYFKTDETTQIKYKIQSFGPKQNSTYYKTHCKIIKQELFESSNSRAYSSYLNRNLNQTLPNGNNLLNDVNKVQFFAQPSFRDFLFDNNLDTQCSNIRKPQSQRWVPNEIKSIKTNACLLIFSNYNCLGRSVPISTGGSANLTRDWELTVSGPTTLDLLYTQFPNWTWTTESFRPCLDVDRGQQLDVDIIRYSTEVLETYRNVCSCINIHKYIRLMDKWSINNHGRSLVAYFEPDCSSSAFVPLWVPAGTSSFSLGLGLFKKTDTISGSVHEIQSFGPDPNAEYFQINCRDLFLSQFIHNVTKNSSRNVSAQQKHFVMARKFDHQTLEDLAELPDKVEILNSLIKNLTAKVNEWDVKMYNYENIMKDMLLKQKDEFNDLACKIKAGHDETCG